MFFPSAACPPYHLALVIGGLSAEQTLKTVKLASTKYLDDLPTTGNAHGRAFRDLEWEARILKLTQDMGIGAQFGGKYFCHDIRVVRLPRHGASCPVGLGVSCSADRQILGKITGKGVFLEQLETNPGRFLPEVTDAHLDAKTEVVNVNLNQPMDDIRKTLSQVWGKQKFLVMHACTKFRVQYPVRTRLSLSGSLVVARDIAHAKIQERLDAGLELPDYIRNHIVYYGLAYGSDN